MKALENQTEKIEDLGQDIEPPMDIFEAVDNDGDVLELELEQMDETKNMDSQAGESKKVVDGLILEPDDPKLQKDIELPKYLVDVDTNMPIGKRDKITLRLKKDFPGSRKGIPQKRIDMLNAAGILLDGKPWETTKQFSDQLTCARRRAKKVKKS